MKIFQNFRKIFYTPADAVANRAFHHIFSLGNLRFFLAQNVVGIHSPGLDGRELVKSGVEDRTVFLVQNDLLRGQGWEHHIRLKAGVSVQGALVMLPLAALVAVTLTAPGREHNDDLVGDFQGDIFGHVGIVSSYAAFSKGRFIYLSSEEIYGDSGDLCPNGLSEEALPSPNGYRGTAVMQGEGICENCRKAQGKDVVVLRLDHLYGMPRKGQKEEGICFRKCLESVKSGTVSAAAGNTFSMLHVKDAAAFIYAVMSAKDHKCGDYQLSSMKEISELELARMISEEAGFPVDVLERETGGNKRRMLNGSRFAEEFGLRAIADNRKEIGEIVRFMKHSRSAYVDSEEAAAGGKARLRAAIKGAFPFVENVVCCVLFGLLSSQAAGSRYFERLDFFLLYVLLFAIMHGQQQAILSALLAVLGYFFQQTIGRSGFEVLLDYNTYVWTAQLFIVGMAVGITRDRMYHIREEQEEEILFLKKRVKNIEEINDSNVRMKQGFETELVNQREPWPGL
jgi:nucleoside-diphosphate-sugar epimerase